MTKTNFQNVMNTNHFTAPVNYLILSEISLNVVHYQSVIQLSVLLYLLQLFIISDTEKKVAEGVEEAVRENGTFSEVNLL